MPETARNITAPGCLPKNLPSQLSKASSLRMQRAKDSAHHITTPTSARYADPDAPSPSNHYYHSPSLKSSSCENISLSYMRMQRAKSSAQHITPQTSSRRTHLDAPLFLSSLSSSASLKTSSCENINTHVKLLANLGELIAPNLLLNGLKPM